MSTWAIHPLPSGLFHSLAGSSLTEGWWAFLMTSCGIAVHLRLWKNRREVRAFLRRTPLADCPSVGVGPLGQGEQGKPSESPCLAGQELEHIALAEAFWQSKEGFSCCPSGWELSLCAGQAGHSSALARAGCRDLQQGSCSEGRAQLPSALPRALGWCCGRECCGVCCAQRGWQCPGVTGTPSEWSQPGWLLDLALLPL